VEGLPARGTVTLLVRQSVEQRDVLRTLLDLSKFR
jgi:hypothetical protein